jgi:hypothetical protein
MTELEYMGRGVEVNLRKEIGKERKYRVKKPALSMLEDDIPVSAIVKYTGLYRHRAIHKYWDLGYFLLFFKLIYVVENKLCSAYGECGNYYASIPGNGFVYYLS